MHLCRPPLPLSRLQPEYRFIRTLQAPDHVVLDKNAGRYRISSKAFGPSRSDGGLSGDLEQPLVADGLPALALYPAVDRAVGAASLTVGQILAHGGLSVQHVPVRSNWYHGNILGITGGIKKRLSKQALEIVPIDQDAAARRDALRSQAAGLGQTAD